MKKFPILLSGGAVLLLVFCVVVTMLSPRYQASKLLDTDLPRPVQTQWEDNHGGFHGDGILLGQLTFSPSSGKSLEKNLSQDARWQPLPMGETLALFLSGGEKDGVTYGGVWPEGKATPAVEEGYYFFLDRLHNTTADDLLLDDSSHNITVGLYDCQQSTLYLFTYDS